MVALLLLSLQISQSNPPREPWNQTKALAIVDSVLEFEAKNPAWDKISWVKDKATAEKLATEKNKPIFVHWYVAKGGPADSPC